MIFTVYFFAFLVVMLFSMIFYRKDSFVGRYSRNVMIGCTQFLNILTGGHPDQSFSGRSGYNRATKGGVWVYIADFIDQLFKLVAGEKDHCLNSVEHDRPKTVDYKIRKLDVLQIFGVIFCSSVLGFILSHTI